MMAVIELFVWMAVSFSCAFAAHFIAARVGREYPRLWGVFAFITPLALGILLLLAFDEEMK